MKKLSALALALITVMCIMTGCVSGGEEPPRPTPTPKVYNTHPLTGEEKTADYPYGNRPVAVMINNIMSSDKRQSSWPQHGMSGADVVFEMETEGGITRYMALFRDWEKMGTVGPIRSARDQFVQMMLPYGSLYVHDGASTYAKRMLATYNWEDKDLQPNKGVAYRDTTLAPNKAYEHTEFTTGRLITEAINGGQYEISAYEEPVNSLFKWVKYDEEPRILDSIDVNKIDWYFSSSYASTMTYNRETAKYTKEHINLASKFSKPLIDASNDNKPVEFDNVFILWTQIERYPDNVLAKVDLAWGGVGYYFNNGKMEKVRWMKGSPHDPLRIVSLDGTETDIEINTGKSYIAVVDLDYFGTFAINDTLVDVAGDYRPAEDIENQEGVEAVD